MLQGCETCLSMPSLSRGIRESESLMWRGRMRAWRLLESMFCRAQWMFLSSISAGSAVGTDEEGHGSREGYL